MGDSDKLGAGHECDNWEIRVKTPTPGLEGLTGGLESGENMKLSPRVGGDREEERGETINMDECWTINIKVVATSNWKLFFEKKQIIFHYNSQFTIYPGPGKPQH